MERDAKICVVRDRGMEKGEIRLGPLGVQSRLLGLLDNGGAEVRFWGARDPTEMAKYKPT